MKRSERWKTPAFKISLLHIVIALYIVSLLPFFALSQSLYERTRDITISNMVDMISNEQQQTMDHFLSQISSLWAGLYQCENLQDTSKLKIITNGVYTRSEIDNAKYNLYRQLIAVMVSQEVARNVEAYFTYENLLISSSQGIRVLPTEKISFLNSLSIQNHMLLIYHGQKLYLSTTKNSLSAYAHGDRNQLPLVVIWAEVFPSVIFSHEGDERLRLLLWNETNEVLYCSDPEFALDPSILREQDSGYTMMRSDGKDRYVFWNRSGKLGITIIEVLDKEGVMGELSALEWQYWTVLVVVAVISILIIVLTYNVIYRPAKLLLQGFQRSGDGELGVTLPIRHISREFDMIFHGFNKMTLNIKRMVEQDYKQQILMQEAQMKQLQFQINPHFLYNSFFILNSMLTNGDYDSAEEMSNLLGKYLNYITQDKELLVDLEKEVEHAMAYSDIQMMRFRPRIHMEAMELPQELCNVQVPKIILQPLIENVFQHGLKDIVKDGLIRVSYETQGRAIFIIVDDNGVTPDDSALENISAAIREISYSQGGVALNNIERRLKMQYGEESGLTATVSPLGGLRMTIRIIPEI